VGACRELSFPRAFGFCFHFPFVCEKVKSTAENYEKQVRRPRQKRLLNSTLIFLVFILFSIIDDKNAFEI
jgi:hypothetical protein